MASITVNISREAKHWGIQFAINGEIQPRDIFACREALTPLLRGLMAAESENATVRPIPEAHAPIRPSTITVGMPSGRVLTFTLTALQDTLANAPQGLSG